MRKDFWHRNACCFFTVATIFVASRTANAQGSIVPPTDIISTYLSNTGEPSGGSVYYGNDYWIAQSFETGNIWADYILSGPTGISGSGAPTSELAFYTDNNGVPGIELGSGGITLSAATVYWLVATASEPSQSSGGVRVFAKQWNYASDANYAASDNWSLNPVFALSSNGLNWTTGTSHDPFQLFVSATPAPEPKTLTLLALGLASILLKLPNKIFRYL